MKTVDPQQIFAITRPHKKLFWLYFITSFAGTVFQPLVFLPLYFRFHTLKYKFDEEGVSASWGILFRREVVLTYARIQDIHLNSNLIERWLGLAKIQISTASGSSSAEMTIEGFLEYELVRDFLYAKMRGSHHEASGTKLATTSTGPASTIAGAEVESIVAALQQVSEDLRAVRQALEKR